MPILDTRDWVVVEALEEASRTGNYAGIASRLNVTEDALRKNIQRNAGKFTPANVVKTRETMIAKTKVNTKLDGIDIETIERVEALETVCAKMAKRVSDVQVQLDVLMRMVRKALPSINGDLVTAVGSAPMPHLMAAMQAVALAFGVTDKEIIGVRRVQRFSMARHAFCFLAHANGSVNVTTVARYINRDHSTVIYAVQNHRVRMGNDVYASQWDEALKHYESLLPDSLVPRILRESLKPVAANADGVGKEAV